MSVTLGATHLGIFEVTSAPTLLQVPGAPFLAVQFGPYYLVLLDANGVSFWLYVNAGELVIDGAAPQLGTPPPGHALSLGSSFAKMWDFGLNQDGWIVSSQSVPGFDAEYSDPTLPGHPFIYNAGAASGRGYFGLWNPQLAETVYGAIDDVGRLAPYLAVPL